MTFQFDQIEYNTETLGGTFERISRVEASAFSRKNDQNPLVVEVDAFERVMIKSLRRFEDALVARLSEKAVNRVLTSGRWAQSGPAALICEVMTDKSIRKGSLSHQGRQDRARQIARAIQQRGEVEFAILLLPFRTASPLKNRGTLPDMGEFYTLVSLHALARACRQAQVVMGGLVESIVKRVGSGARGCVEDAGSGPGDETAALFERAMKECEQFTDTPKACAAARKRLRQMEAGRPAVRVHDETTFVRLLVDLANAAIPLDAWLAFNNAPITPVRILTCQDAGRYPCFESVSRVQISEYRTVLLDVVRALGIDDDMLRLVDYTEIKSRAERTAGRGGSKQYFEERKADFLTALDAALPALWRARGREAMRAELASIDPDGVLSPLFEPILFSLEHPEIAPSADQFKMDADGLYLEIMQKIYEPQSAPPREELRRRIMANSLRGAALYCAAYEANTGSKNPGAFDDVATMFPDALRMSIHQKDDSVGHFSIHVSPTGNRTPWHGTACLMSARTPELVQIGIDLAGLLEMTSARRIIASGKAAGVLGRHVATGQPIAYLLPSLGITTEKALLELLESKLLAENG